MQNEATFHIIGRVSRKNVRDKVVFLNVAVNRKYKDDHDKWHETAVFLSVTFFQNRKWAEAQETGSLVRISGYIVPSEHKSDGEIIYKTDMVARRSAILCKAQQADE
tara:strand:- start:63879 stop:64199 length:321 start_codon:yes stop_codon:yes gene_type:complete